MPSRSPVTPLLIGWVSFNARAAALAVLLWWDHGGVLVFGHLDRGTDGLLALSGVVTALPLIWFAEGAKRLRLATMGFLQYLAPTGQLLLATLFFGEPFTRDHALSFGLIWVALALYSYDALKRRRSRRR